MRSRTSSFWISMMVVCGVAMIGFAQVPYPIPGPNPNFKCDPTALVACKCVNIETNPDLNCYAVDQNRMLVWCTASGWRPCVMANTYMCPGGSGNVKRKGTCAVSGEEQNLSCYDVSVPSCN